MKSPSSIDCSAPFNHLLSIIANESRATLQLLSRDRGVIASRKIASPVLGFLLSGLEFRVSGFPGFHFSFILAEVDARSSATICSRQFITRARSTALIIANNKSNVIIAPRHVYCAFSGGEEIFHVSLVDARGGFSRLRSGHYTRFRSLETIPNIVPDRVFFVTGISCILSMFAFANIRAVSNN